MQLQQEQVPEALLRLLRGAPSLREPQHYCCPPLTPHPFPSPQSGRGCTDACKCKSCANKVAACTPAGPFVLPLQRAGGAATAVAGETKPRRAAPPAAAAPSFQLAPRRRGAAGPAQLAAPAVAVTARRSPRRPATSRRCVPPPPAPSASPERPPLDPSQPLARAAVSLLGLGTPAASRFRQPALLAATPLRFGGGGTGPGAAGGAACTPTLLRNTRAPFSPPVLGSLGSLGLAPGSPWSMTPFAMLIGGGAGGGASGGGGGGLELTRSAARLFLGSAAGVAPSPWAVGEGPGAIGLARGSFPDLQALLGGSSPLRVGGAPVAEPPAEGAADAAGPARRGGASKRTLHVMAEDGGRLSQGQAAPPAVEEEAIGGKGARRSLEPARGRNKRAKAVPATPAGALGTGAPTRTPVTPATA